MARRPRFLDPEPEADGAEDDRDERAEPREEDPAEEAIDDVDRPLRVRPARDVPDDHPLKPELEPDERVAPRAAREERRVDGRRLLAEEAVRPEGRGEARETVERERAGPAEVVDEDVLDRALAVHEREELDVRGLEAEVGARALVAVRILEDGVRRPVAGAEIGALVAGDRTRHERGVVQPVT